MAIGAYASPVQPIATKIVHVRISVAIVIPEIGFDELPMSPVMRDDTLTKKKPNTTVSTRGQRVAPGRQLRDHDEEQCQRRASRR